MRKKILALTLAILLFVAVAAPAQPSLVDYCRGIAATEMGLYNQIKTFIECYEAGNDYTHCEY